MSWKGCVRIGVTAFVLYLAVYYWGAVSGLFGLVVGAAGPLIIGACAAYVLNILMSFYERHYFPRSQKAAVQRTRRPACMLSAILTLVVIIVGVVALVVPQLVSCVQLLWEKVPGAMDGITSWLRAQEWLPGSIRSLTESIDWRAKLGEMAGAITSGVGNVLGFVAGTVSSVFSGVTTALLSLIFAIYLLAGRDQLGRQAQRMMRSYLPGLWYDRVLHVLHVLNDCFHRYIVGQCTEALILGSLCALGMMLLGLPYATMIGALVAFTALIPVAGAYIGAGVGAFMILTVSPVQALIFLVFLVVLQQLEGNLIYPRVVGSSIGLPGMWVMAVVIVGGSLMGIGGMLLGVPLGAAAYRLVREDVLKREQQHDS